MGCTFEFSSPEDDATWDRLIIRRASVQAGPYIVIGTVSAKDKNNVWVTEYWDVYGMASNFYTAQWYDSVQNVYGPQSTPISALSPIGYLTVSEARKLGKFQPSEYDDETMEMLISQATQDLDQRTGRTWKGIQTVVDEYYDGNGYNYLQLRNIDIASLDALSTCIDDNGNWTAVNVTQVAWYQNGSIVLDINMNPLLTASVFALGNKNVRVSYKYGNPEPTASVKELMMLLLFSRIKIDDKIEKQIAQKVERLKNKGVHMV